MITTTRFALLSGLCLLALSAGLTCGRVALDDPTSGAGGSAGDGGSSGVAGNSGGSGGQGQGQGGNVGQGQGGNVGQGGDLGAVGGADGCTGLDEMTCLSRSYCRTDYCPGCGPDQFARCAPLYAAKTLCVTPPCLPPGPPGPPAPCGQTMSRDACDARADCHSVLIDEPAACDCPPLPASCACLALLYCADGDRARCQPPTPICKQVAPTCGAGYAVSYTASCIEGCVAVKDCDVAPKGPPPP